MNNRLLTLEAWNCAEQPATRHEPVDALTRPRSRVLHKPVAVPVRVQVKRHQGSLRLKLARLPVAAVAEHELVVGRAVDFTAVVERDLDERGAGARLLRGRLRDDNLVLGGE